MANHLLIDKNLIRVGDTVKIFFKRQEGEKIKDQVFQGILIAIRGNGSNKMITVRKMTKSGIGVERIFPVASPNFSKIQLIKKATKVRRAKLYFIRKMSQSEIRQRLYRH